MNMLWSLYIAPLCWPWVVVATLAFLRPRQNLRETFSPFLDCCDEVGFAMEECLGRPVSGFVSSSCLGSCLWFGFHFLSVLGMVALLSSCPLFSIGTDE